MKKIDLLATHEARVLARYWLAEMAANNAIENNPFTTEDHAMFEQMIESGMSSKQAVALILDEHRARQNARLDAAE